METDVIRDMTKRCKNCGNYYFELNADGLCDNCANGNPPQITETDSGWDDW